VQVKVQLLAGWLARVPALWQRFVVRHCLTQFVKTHGPLDTVSRPRSHTRMNRAAVVHEVEGLQGRVLVDGAAKSHMPP
jgi:hypothetical protein